MTPTADAPAAASSVRTVACMGGISLERDVPTEELHDYIRDPDTLVWMDLQDPGPAELSMLLDEFGFHPLALEDVAKGGQRPKVDEYKGYLFLVTHGVLPVPGSAGGAFETISSGNRLSGELLGDPRPLASDGSGLWLQQFGWSTSKAIGSTAKYNVHGWGATGGYERQLGGLGSVGITAAFAAGRDTKSNNELVSDHYEGGVYWRGGSGPLRTYARATAGRVKFNGTRRFNGTVNDVAIQRESEGKWKGNLYSGLAGVSYELRSGRFSIRPSASIDYMKLNEKGYTEAGGGEAFDLTVHNRKSSETGANALLALGYDVMGGEPNSNWLRVELQGGRRQVLSGSLGATRASFGDGEVFTLTPEERSSGWRGAFRVTGGGSAMSIAAEIGAEEVQGRAAVNGRIGVNIAL